MSRKKNFLMCFSTITILGILIIAGCMDEKDTKEESVEFGEQDLMTWKDVNENAQYMSSKEIIDILIAHMGEICLGGQITAFTSTGATGKGLDKETGKSPAWQFYLLRYDGTQAKSTVINIAENGWTIVSAEHDVADIYDEWEYYKAEIDSSELPAIANANATVSDWISTHANYQLEIQSYHGPPIDSTLESYIMKFTSGDDELNVYVFATDGTIIEVEDPNDWSW